MSKRITARKDLVSKRLTSLEKYVNTHKGDIKNRVVYSAFTPTTGGDVFYVTSLGQGTDASTRSGDAINLHHINNHVNFQMTKTCNVRVVIFRDKFNNGTIPGISEILDSADAIAPLNYINTIVQKRFTILEDYVKHFTVGGILTDTHLKTISQDVKVRYSGAGYTYASALSNNIYAAVIADTASAGTIALYSRFTYTDE